MAFFFIRAVLVRVTLYGAILYGTICGFSRLRPDKGLTKKTLRKKRRFLPFCVFSPEDPLQKQGEERKEYEAAAKHPVSCVFDDDAARDVAARKAVL